MGTRPSVAYLKPSNMPDPDNLCSDRDERAERQNCAQHATIKVPERRNPVQETGHWVPTKGHALEFSVKPGLPSSRGKVAVQTRATTAPGAL